MAVRQLMCRQSSLDLHAQLRVSALGRIPLEVQLVALVIHDESELDILGLAARGHASLGALAAHQVRVGQVSVPLRALNCTLAKNGGYYIENDEDAEGYEDCEEDDKLLTAIAEWQDRFMPVYS